MLRDDIGVFNNANWYMWTFTILSGGALMLGVVNLWVFLVFVISGTMSWFTHLIHQDQRQLRQQARIWLKRYGHTWEGISQNQQQLLLLKFMAQSKKSLWLEMFNLLFHMFLLWGMCLGVVALANSPLNPNGTAQLDFGDWTMLVILLLVGCLPLSMVMTDIKSLWQLYHPKHQ